MRREAAEGNETLADNMWAQDDEKAKVSGGRKINRNKCLPTGIMKEQNHTWVDASDGGDAVLYPSRFLLLL